MSGDEELTESGPSLVTIRSVHGPRPPLFCVHAEAGDVTLYHGVASHLEPDRSVLGLCAPAAGVLPPGASLELLAEYQTREVRRVQPRGPYLLLGECTGGALAFEIARQLRAAGEEVGLLAVVDAFAPGAAQVPWPISKPAYRIAHRLRILLFHAGNMVRLAPRAKLAYAASKAARVRAALDARSAARRNRSKAPGDARLQFRRASAVYRPGPYDRSILLLRATHLPLGISVPSDLGWGALTENLEVVTIPGYFTTPISPPGVSVLAQALDARLSARG